MRPHSKVFVPEPGYMQKAIDKRACDRKVGYRTAEAAENSAKGAMGRVKEDLIIYHCSNCDKYHMAKASNSSFMIQRGDNIVKTISKPRPTKWRDYDVEYDKNGIPFYRLELCCSICKKPEPAIRKLTLAGGEITKAQAVYPTNPELIKPEKFSPLWVHMECQNRQADELKEAARIAAEAKERLREIAAEDKELIGAIMAVPAPPEPIAPEVKEEELPVRTGRVVRAPKPPELPFGNDTILDMLGFLDPTNTKITDAAARGMAWLFVREIVEKILSK